MSKQKQIAKYIQLVLIFLKHNLGKIIKHTYILALSVLHLLIQMFLIKLIQK